MRLSRFLYKISVRQVWNSGLLSIKFLCVTLSHMSIGSGVIVAITFQQIDDAPHAETGTESDNEGLKNGDCLIEKFHK